MSGGGLWLSPTAHMQAPAKRHEAWWPTPGDGGGRGKGIRMEGVGRTMRDGGCGLRQRRGGRAARPSRRRAPGVKGGHELEAKSSQAKLCGGRGRGSKVVRNGACVCVCVCVAVATRLGVAHEDARFGVAHEWRWTVVVAYGTDEAPAKPCAAKGHVSLVQCISRHRWSSNAFRNAAAMNRLRWFTAAACRLQARPLVARHVYGTAGARAVSQPRADSAKPIAAAARRRGPIA
jgi:hypothetical protein